MQLFDTQVAPAVAEARLLHPQDYGFFAVGRKTPGSASGKGWSEKHFPMSSLDAVATSLRGCPDAYISQASFATKLRKSFNTKSLRSTFIDLDTYNLSGNDSPEVLVDRVIARAREVGVPDPSYIASSGRGLYAKWVYDAPINASLMPQWKLLAKKMVSAYLPMGADSKVVDPARVLRLQETINSKSGTAVHLLHQGTTHSFADLFRSSEGLEVLRRDKDGKIVKGPKTLMRQGLRLSSAELASDAALTDLDGLRLYSARNEPVLRDLKLTASSLNWCRFLDLRDLVIARGGIHRGSRDITLFWMINFLAQTHVIRAENFWQETRELLQSFPVCRDFDPLNDGSLQSLFERVQAHSRGEKVMLDGCEYIPMYTPKNDTLINLLQITPEEESGLRTIISHSEKLRRADELVPGRQERRQERQDAREIAVSLSEQGVCATEIARRLGKNRSTIGRWLDTPADVGRPYIETRGRRAHIGHRTHFCKLTGKGPVYLSAGPGSAPLLKQPTTPPGLAPPANLARSDQSPNRPWTHDEMRRRCKTRQHKPHHQPTRKVWSADEINAWLLERRQAQQIQVQDRQAGETGPVQHEHEVSSLKLTLEIIDRVRRAARSQPPKISTPGTGVAANPKTGPPPP